jgi:hypothetical protein
LTVFVFPQPQYVACSECGVCMPRWEADDHVCDKERRLDYQVGRLREAITAFEYDLGQWLATRTGRFAVFYAERTRP